MGFGKIIAPIYFGLASSKFVQNKYSEAVRLFEKSLILDPNSKGIEYHYSCLGRCYVYLEQYDKATEILNKAYDLYFRDDLIPKEGFKFDEFKKMLKAYNKALLNSNKYDRAQEVVKDSRKLGINIDEDKVGDVVD